MCQGVGMCWGVLVCVVRYVGMRRGRVLGCVGDVVGCVGEVLGVVVESERGCSWS